jgi:hypothetical protein
MLLYAFIKFKLNIKITLLDFAYYAVYIYKISNSIVNIIERFFRVLI